jgi:hypothetical protein
MGAVPGIVFERNNLVRNELARALSQFNQFGGEIKIHDVVRMSCSRVKDAATAGSPVGRIMAWATRVERTTTVLRR